MTRNIRFSLNRDAEPTTPDGIYGIIDGDTVRETGCPWGTKASGGAHALDQVRLLPPCFPSKIVCVGRNYREHASELGNEAPPEPLIFLKPQSSLIGHRDSIVYPAISNRVDYEGELGIIIGHRARRVSAEEAWDYVFGYTCVNDITARDLQKKDGQWTRGKGFDTFCAVGPWIVPRKEVRFEDLHVRTFVDNEKKQDGAVTDMLFSIPRILEYVSGFMTLEPGDLLATGTPAGVGSLQPGSVVRVVIEGVGALENTVTR
jgi:2-keto-4-pentenoate hydratase/2-oxohepta-3-ene-1,7-dioic acid hydratase in catechol pathway